MHGRPGPVAAHRVHQHVDAPETAEHLCHRPLDGLRVAGIHTLQKEGLWGPRPAREQPVHHPARPVQHGHSRPGLLEGFSHRLPQVAAGAGHQGDLLVEFVHPSRPHFFCCDPFKLLDRFEQRGTLFYRVSPFCPPGDIPLPVQQQDPDGFFVRDIQRLPER